MSLRGRHRLRSCVFAALLIVPLPACAGVDPSPEDPASSPHPSSSGPSVTSSAAPSSGTDPARLPARTRAGATCVDGLLSRMSPSERAGQVLLVGVPIASTRSVHATVRTYRPGGVFLQGRSSSGAAATRRHVTALQSAAARAGAQRLHIAVDQEGGRVQTLQGRDFGRIPAALTQGGWSPTTMRRQVGGWARDLRRAGVTMNLAPVADTVGAGSAPHNPPVGVLDRQYGHTPGSVAADVSVVVSATQAQGVVATLKHFPGLGRVRVNPDHSARAVDLVATTDDPNLRPFQVGIDAGAGAVMISSARYPRLDRDRVATFSRPVISGLLREDLGFSGVVVSDDLGAAVAMRGVPVGARAVRFVEAGGDLVLTVRYGDARVMRDALRARAGASGTFRHRLDDAARRVLLSKHRVGLLRCPVPGDRPRTAPGDRPRTS